VNNIWAFLPMRGSTDLLGDPEGLRARLAEDSYLYLPGLLDAQKVLDLRRDVVEVLGARGWLRNDQYLIDAISVIPPLREGEDAFLEVYDAVQRLEAFHTLAHDPDLVQVMQQVVGPTAFPHPLKIARLSFPANYEVSTPPHQDYPNNQGTQALTASWIPLGDCPLDLGGLAVLRGSHRYGVLPLDVHPGPGNRQAVVPLEMLEELRWVTTDFSAGDVLLFPSTAVHASLHNASEHNMRLSVDFRYQQEGEPLTEMVLHPHFQRQTWEEIYAGWSSTTHQYYWRDLDFEIVPFEVFPVLTPDPEEVPWVDILRHDHKINVRHERRMARLDQQMADDLAPWEPA
jgi:hypothetical protein